MSENVEIGSIMPKMLSYIMCVNTPIIASHLHCLQQLQSTLFNPTNSRCLDGPKTFLARNVSGLEA